MNNNVSSVVEQIRWNKTMKLYHDYLNKSDSRHVFIVEVVAVAGVVIMLFGYRFLRFAMFVCGFWLSFCVFYTFSPIFIRQHYSCDKSKYHAVHIVSSVAVGTIVGLFTASLYRFGILLIGKCLGFLTALALLHTSIFENVSNYYIISIFVTLVALVTSALTWKFEKVLMILSTSLVGSFTFLCGIDIFTQSNFSLLVVSVLVYLRDAFVIIVQRNIHTSKKSTQLPSFHDSLKAATTNSNTLLTCAWICLSICSAVFQFTISSKNAAQGGEIVPIKSLCKCLCCCRSSKEKEKELK